MRRILIVLSVAALMAAMMVASVVPAIAQPSSFVLTCQSGGTTLVISNDEQGFRFHNEARRLLGFPANECEPTVVRDTGGAGGA